MISLSLQVISDYLEASRLMIFDVPGAPQRGRKAGIVAFTRRSKRHDRSAARQAMREHMKQVAEDAEHAGAARNLTKGAT